MTKLSPQATYRAEKEKARRERDVPHKQLMAEAHAAFDQLMADGRAARKGGRPKREKVRNRPGTAEPANLGKRSCSSLGWVLPQSWPSSPG